MPQLSPLPSDLLVRVFNTKSYRTLATGTIEAKDEGYRLRLDREKGAHIEEGLVITICNKDPLTKDQKKILPKDDFKLYGRVIKVTPGSTESVVVIRIRPMEKSPTTRTA